jgi:hypothetical protein
MNARILCAVSVAGLVLPLWVWAQSSAPPASPPAQPEPASKPAGLPLTVDEKTGALKIGQPPAPFIQELFVYNGKKTSPAPTEIVVGDSLTLPGFSGKYPVALAAGLTGALKGRMWGIYTDTLLDVTHLDPATARLVFVWQVLSPKGEVLANIGMNLSERSSIYISPKRVVYAESNRKVPENGPFTKFVFPVKLGVVTVSRNGAKIVSAKAEEGDATSYSLEKVAPEDLIEWETSGDNAALGSIHPIVVGAEAGLVEYHMSVPK